ncbi:hypothetical protein A9Q84_18760 [Halobacteriovorax marinus]|uniref:Uncharacterized protein n=1 Tax=Halobacteriovorax marinus TaxID=97084 RepID=A0A1Y5F250_9BACT|nr:hypothetical protein A9Q84_18760 [Halobacteriovorax marinus]
MRKLININLLTWSLIFTQVLWPYEAIAKQNLNVDQEIQNHVMALQTAAANHASKRHFENIRSRTAALAKKIKSKYPKKAKELEDKILRPMAGMIKAKASLKGCNLEGLSGGIGLSSFKGIKACEGEIYTSIDVDSFISGMDKILDEAKGNKSTAKDRKNFADLVYSKMRNSVISKYWENKAMFQGEMPEDLQKAIVDAHGTKTIGSASTGMGMGYTSGTQEVSAGKFRGNLDKELLKRLALIQERTKGFSKKDREANKNKYFQKTKDDYRGLAKHYDRSFNMESMTKILDKKFNPHLGTWLEPNRPKVTKEEKQAYAWAKHQVETRQRAANSKPVNFDDDFGGSALMIIEQSALVKPKTNAYDMPILGAKKTETANETASKVAMKVATYMEHNKTPSYQQRNSKYAPSSLGFDARFNETLGKRTPSSTLDFPEIGSSSQVSDYDTVVVNNAMEYYGLIPKKNSNNPYHKLDDDLAIERSKESPLNDATFHSAMPSPRNDYDDDDKKQFMIAERDISLHNNINNYMALKHGVSIKRTSKSGLPYRDNEEELEVNPISKNKRRELAKYRKRIIQDMSSVTSDDAEIGKFGVTEKLAEDWLNKFDKNMDKNLKLYMKTYGGVNKVANTGDNGIKVHKNHPAIVKLGAAETKKSGSPYETPPTLIDLVNKAGSNAYLDMGKNLSGVDPRITKNGLSSYLRDEGKQSAIKRDKHQARLERGNFLIHEDKKLRNSTWRGLNESELGDEEMDAKMKQAFSEYFKDSETLMQKLDSEYTSENSGDFLKMAMKNNPGIVGQVLADHPEYAGMTCNISKEAIADQKSAQKWDRILSTAGLVLAAGSIIITGGTAALVLAGAGMAIGARQAIKSTTDYFDLENEYQLAKHHLEVLGLGNDASVQAQLEKANARFYDAIMDGALLPFEVFAFTHALKSAKSAKEAKALINAAANSSDDAISIAKSSKLKLDEVATVKVAKVESKTTTFNMSELTDTVPVKRAISSNHSKVARALPSDPVSQLNRKSTSLFEVKEGTSLRGKLKTAKPISTSGVDVIKLAKGNSLVKVKQARTFSDNTKKALKDLSKKGMTKFDDFSLDVASNLTDAERLALMEVKSGKPLSTAQKELILKAHNVELSKGFGNYTHAGKRQKMKYLKEAFPNDPELRRYAMKKGITGGYGDLSKEAVTARADKFIKANGYDLDDLADLKQFPDDYEAFLGEVAKHGDDTAKATELLAFTDDLDVIQKISSASAENAEMVKFVRANDMEAYKNALRSAESGERFALSELKSSYTSLKKQVKAVEGSFESGFTNSFKTDAASYKGKNYTKGEMEIKSDLMAGKLMEHQSLRRDADYMMKTIDDPNKVKVDFTGDSSVRANEIMQGKRGAYDSASSVDFNYGSIASDLKSAEKTDLASKFIEVKVSNSINSANKVETLKIPLGNDRVWFDNFKKIEKSAREGNEVAQRDLRRSLLELYNDSTGKSGRLRSKISTSTHDDLIDEFLDIKNGRKTVSEEKFNQMIEEYGSIK